MPVIDKSQFHSRQLDFITPRELVTPITVLGAGGIGSWTTLALTKLGCSNVTAVDFDKVGAENVGSQLYGEGDIGRDKVEALRGHIQGLTGQVLKTEVDKWDGGENTFTEISISAVDSMPLRRQIWNKIKQNFHVRWYIDARMGGELIRIYTVNMLQNSEWYPKYFPTSDSQIEPEPCTSRAIVYNTFACASLIARQVKAIIKGDNVPREMVFDLKTMSMFCN